MSKKQPSVEVLKWAESIFAVGLRTDASNQRGTDVLVKLARTDEKMRNDAIASLALQLEYLVSESDETKYQANKALSLFPVNSEGGDADAIAIRHVEVSGDAKVLASSDVRDLPTVSYGASKESRNVVSLGNKLQYSIFDLMRAAMLGEQIDATLLAVARRAFESGVDTLSAFGNAAAGIPSGILNDASVSTEALAAAGTWASKTAAQILDDLNKLVLGFVGANEDLEDAAPDMLVLPSASLTRISQTRMGDSTSDTVLKAFLMSNPSISRVESWGKCNTAGSGSSKRALLVKNDPMTLQIRVPAPFQLLEPQHVGFGVEVPAYGRCAGAIVHRPLELRYMDGI